MDIVIYIEILLLLFAANGAPILAKKLFADRFNTPIDLHYSFFDKQPLFGKSKTYRGIIASMLLTSGIAWLLGYSPMIGIGVALTAMCGDLLSSFTKRRLHIRTSNMALGLDQVPESLLPLLFLSYYVELSVEQIITLVALFFALELVISRLLYWMHIRSRPY